MNWKKTALICLFICGFAAAVTTLIYSTEPTAQKEGATKESAMLVNVEAVREGTFTPVITTTGVVQPEQDILLSPRIQGMITSLSPGFVPGGIVREGQVLLTLDPSDYENQLKMRESELGQAMAQLRIEMGQQEVARRDYELVDRELVQFWIWQGYPKSFPERHWKGNLLDTFWRLQSNKLPPILRCQLLRLKVLAFS